LSEEKFADFLVLNHADHETTFYRDIFRLRPAHLLTANLKGAIEHRRYWSPTDIKPVRLDSDQAYAEGLRECLDRAVRRQMRSIHPIGCYLSGGLDSSSVAVLAARALGEKGQRLAAFTQVPRDGFDGPVPVGRYADETPYVEAIRQTAGTIDVSYVRNDECDDFADLERFFLFLDGPVRNPTNLGWMLAIPRLARSQGRRVLFGGLSGNYTISWSGWSQAVDHLVRGRLVTAYRHWRLFYHRTSYSRWVAFRKLLVEPLMPVKMRNWGDRRRRDRIAPWQKYSAILPEFAFAMGVDARARAADHDFLFRPRLGARIAGLAAVDFAGDWMAAEKAVTGVEVRDPTADIDVVTYCFGVPAEQFLAEGIDRSLIRRAMWGLLPDKVLTNRLKGLQSADWFEKVGCRRSEFAAALVELSRSPLVRRAIDLPRLERAIKDWPTDGWDTLPVVDEYHLAFTRGIAGARFLRWTEQANRDVNQ
jgi:asparagine synthase (glutamine-hydrolysing)